MCVEVWPFLAEAQHHSFASFAKNPDFAHYPPEFKRAKMLLCPYGRIRNYNTDTVILVVISPKRIFQVSFNFYLRLVKLDLFHGEIAINVKFNLKI